MKKKKILITGAAGLVGQNLITRLKTRFDLELICVDKHHKNCLIFRKFNPEIKLIEEDLAKSDTEFDFVKDIDIVIIIHAQISGLTETPFIANNVIATQNIINASIENKISYIIHISSSVVLSKAYDFYTQTKIAQEKLILESGIPSVVLRPTLMFGWFDRKHLGWLAHFIKRSPVFPIPNFGRYLRQPLYAGDFCSVIESCIDDPKPNQIFDISGQNKVYYVDLIKLLKLSTDSKSIILPIPYQLFWVLLKVYSFFSKDPPFTTQQLEALVISEEFPIIDWPDIFSVKTTPLEEAFEQVYKHGKYSKVKLEF
ncbi:NAD-dependent epimerase/dehydratase family protein [Alphaproteobacteria bacterium]|nr:NAD-dependent epimerase/dehydratase family protein [Alphaproteobacteria bacterium]